MFSSKTINKHKLKVFIFKEGVLDIGSYSTQTVLNNSVGKVLTFNVIVVNSSPIFLGRLRSMWQSMTSSSIPCWEVTITCRIRVTTGFKPRKTVRMTCHCLSYKHNWHRGNGVTCNKQADRGTRQSLLWILASVLAPCLPGAPPSGRNNNLGIRQPWLILRHTASHPC